MRIAVDFDGTIVENNYPAIGPERPGAVKTLKQLAAEGDDIILWTARSGQYLQDAIDWCEARGLEFFAVNSNYHRCIEHQNGFSGSRKIHADIFIDDRNIGGFPGWQKVYEKISRLKRRIEKEFSKGCRKHDAGIFSRMAFYIRSQSHTKTDYAPAIFKDVKKKDVE